MKKERNPIQRREQALHLCCVRVEDFVSALKWEVEQRSLKMGQIQFPLRALEEWALPDDSLIILNNVVLNTASPSNGQKF